MVDHLNPAVALNFLPFCQIAACKRVSYNPCTGNRNFIFLCQFIQNLPARNYAVVGNNRRHCTDIALRLHNISSHFVAARLTRKEHRIGLLHAGLRRNRYDNAARKLCQCTRAVHRLLRSGVVLHRRQRHRLYVGFQTDIIRRPRRVKLRNRRTVVRQRRKRRVRRERSRVVDSYVVKVYARRIIICFIRNIRVMYNFAHLVRKYSDIV